MTDQPTDSSQPGPQPEPVAEGAAASGADVAPSARAHEWLSQLESMIQNVAREAAPVAREVGAKAAELAGVAAVKAGPAAQRAAAMTTEYGQRFAEKAQSVAADLRHESGAGSPSAEPTDEAPERLPELPEPPEPPAA